MIPRSQRSLHTEGIVHEPGPHRDQGITSEPRVIPLVRQPSRLSEAIPEGRLTEVEGAATTVLARLVMEVQDADEPVAWVLGPRSTLHPPDLEAAGVDLARLTFLRIDGATDRRLRAAELVLRSGGFGLVVVETEAPEVPIRALARLHALCRRHGARVIFRRPRHDPGTLGPLIGLKLRARRAGGHLEFEVLKDKVGGAELPRLSLRLPPGCALPEVPSAKLVFLRSGT